jgi:glutaryl-CoA dehydrogenase
MTTVAAVGTLLPAAASVKKSPKQLLAPNSDFYQLSDVSTSEEKAIVKKVPTYIESKGQPIINKHWSGDAFPFEPLPSFEEKCNSGGLATEKSLTRRGTKCC